MHRQPEGYRAEIQGLRAVAVLSVLLFHAGVWGFSGGFVGVDIFFVISGFLITRILVREYDQTGTVDLRAFWLRRARRLLPNALLTVSAVLVLGVAIVPTYRQPDLAHDAGMALVFLANVRFADAAVDYFRADDPPSPLLHFWSLSLEEQFYIALPILLVLLSFARLRGRRTVMTLLGVATVISFLWSIEILSENQPRAFFHPESRAWQLALGGLIGCGYERLTAALGRLRTAIVWCGAAAVAYAITQYTDFDPYPGVAALLPTFGAAALLIGADQSTILSRVLSAKPAIWIGDRSYSLYLWHWPLIIFSEQLFTGSAVAPVVAAAISVPICHMAYHYVEHPIHRGNFTLPRGLPQTVLATSLLIPIGSALYLAFPSQASTEVIERINFARQDFGRSYKDTCHALYTDVEPKLCTYGPAGLPRILLFGDSHAAQWLEPLILAAEEADWTVQSATKSGCPASSVTIWNDQRRAPYLQCDEWRQAVLSLIEKDPPEIVVIASLSNYRTFDGSKPIYGHAAADRYAAGLASTINRIREAGSRPVLIQDTPQAYRSFLDCIAAGNVVQCARPRKEAIQPGNEIIYKVALELGAPLIDLTNEICDLATCPVEKNSLIVYRDSHHLTATFAMTLAPLFRDIFVSGGGNNMAER